MKALDELLQLYSRNENPYVKDWIESGRYIIGYVCNYIPEEIIWASNMLPYRVEARGCSHMNDADVYMHRFNCTYPRSILQLGLSGDYDFLDGFCFLNGCEQMRRVYEIWSRYVKTKFMGMVAIPHTLSKEGFEWYREELVNFIDSLRGYFGGKKISDEELWDVIRLYNETRKLIGRLYDMRKSKKPPISGEDSFKIILSAFYMPRDRYNELLKEALDEIEKRGDTHESRARIMLGGSALDDPSFIEMIEGRGGLVVTDSLCFGNRFFSDLVEEDGGDPLTALARRYYYRNPCPRMLGEYKKRLQTTEDLARGADVDGIILERIAFCDNHGVDAPMQAKDLEAKGIPVMVLEKEYMLSDIGRLQTRVEAFIERIERRSV